MFSKINRTSKLEDQSGLAKSSEPNRLRELCRDEASKLDKLCELHKLDRKWASFFFSKLPTNRSVF